jgi:drug/metabolite transporter (DMT)-like permease
MAAALILLAVTIVALNLSLDLTLGQVLFLASSGLVGFAFGDTFLFRSYEHNSARITSLIMSTAPAISAVIGYVALDERLSLLAWLGMFVTLSGIALVIQEGRNGAPAMRQFTRAGVIFALLASVGQAGGLVLAKKAFLIGPVDGFVATFVRLGAAIAVVLPLNVLTGRYRQPVKVFAADRKAFALTIIGAFFGPFLGVTFSLIAIANTSVAIAATIMATVPVLMLPTVRVVHKEVLTWRSVVGALAAVAGVALLFAD